MNEDDRYTTKGKTTTAGIEAEAKEEANHDPITGEPGAHPVGTGVGAVSGAAAGAALGGVVGGPVGAMIGAAVGGVAGGLAGKGVAESVNPSEEEAYWRENYGTRPYAASRSYDELGPAYQYGWETWSKHRNHDWNTAEKDLEQGWNQARGNSRLGWNEARHASRDAWDRLESRFVTGERPAAGVTAGTTDRPGAGVTLPTITGVDTDLTAGTPEVPIHKNEDKK